METLFHALVECDHARMFWSMAKDHFGLKVPNLHPATWTEDILDHKVVSKRDAAVAISIMWTIWGRAGIAITMGKFSINHRNLSNWSRSCEGIGSTCIVKCGGTDRSTEMETVTFGLK